MKRGTTLIEILALLVIWATLIGLAAPRVSAGVDRWVVREAREEVIALLYRARLEARRYGEAVVQVETGRGALLVVPGAELGTVEWTPAVRGLEVEVAGTRETAEIAFGPAGTGRVASATVVLRRGRAESSIVVSSYGRIRR